MSVSRQCLLGEWCHRGLILH